MNIKKKEEEINQYIIQLEREKRISQKAPRTLVVQVSKSSYKLFMKRITKYISHGAIIPTPRDESIVEFSITTEIDKILRLLKENKNIIVAIISRRKE